MDLGSIDHNLRRVLLIRRKALGDCLVTLPAVRQLARALPHAQLDLVVDKPFAELISLLVPEVTVIPWAPGKKEPWARSVWYRQLRSKGYDMVIDWLGNPRTALWTAATGAPLRVGYDLPRRRWAYNVRVPQNQHGDVHLRGFAGEAFLDPLRALGLEPDPWDTNPTPGPALKISEEKLNSGFRRWRDQCIVKSKTPIALMMSATWTAKAWPNKRIVELWQGLKAEGLTPILIPGPGDEAMEKVLRESLPSEAFAPPTSLLELADLLQLCAAFVGTDCGGRHLAAALGLPTVTLFGPTNSEGWNPNHPFHVSIKMDLDCLGCEFKTCPLPDRPCLENLPASIVKAGLECVLENMRK